MSLRESRPSKIIDQKSGYRLDMPDVSRGASRSLI